MPAFVDVASLGSCCAHARELDYRDHELEAPSFCTLVHCMVRHASTIPNQPNISDSVISCIAGDTQGTGASLLSAPQVNGVCSFRCSPADGNEKEYDAPCSTRSPDAVSHDLVDQLHRSSSREALEQAQHSSCSSAPAPMEQPGA